MKEKVFEIVSKIPKGKLMTYKQIADKLKSKGYRGIGRILNSNKDYSHVPCHRVVNSDGKVGGYNKGVKEKIRILESEGIEIEKGKIKNLEEYL
jgi:methylated-DNA-[protein]-cysteine S-methyltransferase